MTKLVHESLEGGRHIFKTEWHAQVTESSKWSCECGFISVFNIHTPLMVIGM